MSENRLLDALACRGVLAGAEEAVAHLNAAAEAIGRGLDARLVFR